MKFKSTSRKKKVRIRTDIEIPGDYPWKIASWLCQDLAVCLSADELMKYQAIVRQRDFGKMLQLADEWGLQCIPLHSGVRVDNLRARYQLTALLKKFMFPSDSEARRTRALQKVLQFEQNCRYFNHVGYKDLTDGYTDWVTDVYSYARRFLKKLLGSKLPSGKTMTLWSRHGPGVSLGMCNGNSNAYFKYSDWPYTCTVDAYRYARYAIETDQRWFGALQNSYREVYGIPAHFPLDMKLFWARVVKVVDGNRITFVPKNAQIDRSIAIEPTLNLYLQLGVDGFMRQRLKRWGVDLDDQTKNQRLARLGSISGKYSTIDISGASDSVSLRLCEILLPSEWYSYLVDLRSPQGDLDGDVIVYDKISSMGNGYTFALESAIFTAIVYAVLKADGKAFKADQFAVFGDDIIVPTHVTAKLLAALPLFGFDVNRDKSFYMGLVKESCGADWFNGMPVRPVFLDHLPSGVKELYNDLNRLKRVLELRWGIEDSLTCRNMRKWIPEQFQGDVGPYSDEEFDTYIHAARPRGRAYKWMWRYRRLITKPIAQKGRDFFFRRLMNPLRLVSPPSNRWEKTAQGGVYTVTHRKKLTVGYAYSRSGIWNDEYTELHLRD